MSDREKRRAPRFPLRLLVQCRSGALLFQLTSQDVSVGGICLLTPEPLAEVGERLFLEIYLASGEGPPETANVVGHVVRTDPEVAVAVEFVWNDDNAGERDKLHRYITAMGLSTDPALHSSLGAYIVQAEETEEA